MCEYAEMYTRAYVQTKIRERRRRLDYNNQNDIRTTGVTVDFECMNAYIFCA